MGDSNHVDRADKLSYSQSNNLPPGATCARKVHPGTLTGRIEELEGSSTIVMPSQKLLTGDVAGAYRPPNSGGDRGECFKIPSQKH